MIINWNGCAFKEAFDETEPIAGRPGANDGLDSELDRSSPGICSCAPFVRVQVGGGVYVRAPFVNLWVPPPPIYVGPPNYASPPNYAAPSNYVAPPNAFVPPSPRVVESSPPPLAESQPVPQQTPPPSTDNSPPQPSKAASALTLEQFANTFQPKGGNYDVSIVSPVTNQLTQVRFTLPDGNPRRVHIRRNEVEFDYGVRHFVRIEFDNEGAMVTSR